MTKYWLKPAWLDHWMEVTKETFERASIDKDCAMKITSE
jgi:hypothetical protein